MKATLYVLTPQYNLNRRDLSSDSWDLDTIGCYMGFEGSELP